VKSMFPELGRRENRGKQFTLEDLVTLTQIVYGKFLSKCTAQFLWVTIACN